MTILVTGGAGYIGSHAVAEFIASNQSVVVVDKRPNPGSVPSDIPYYQADIQDASTIQQILADHAVDTVVHFAAWSLVGESVRDPLKYYHNNIGGTERLLSAMAAAGAKRIVFSSTAAVYGEPERTPILETAATVPTNPYGETKLAIERMFRWAHDAFGLQSISLRYFNAAGAHASGDIGEDHNPETHLIPLVLQAALGQREGVQIYGDDYDTPDGTCIRDYIHVMDLASAHRLAVERLRSGDAAVEAFNLGSGNGFSVKEIVDAARAITDLPIQANAVDRRAGDPAVLVASSERAQSVLGWQPLQSTLADMIGSAWRWHQAHPAGYAADEPPLHADGPHRLQSGH